MSEYGEPWSLLDHGGSGPSYGLKDCHGDPLLAAETWFAGEPDSETIARVAVVGYAERITDCVNACAGLNPAGIPFLVQEVQRVVDAMQAAAGTYHDPTNILPTLATALAGVKQGATE